MLSPRYATAPTYYPHSALFKTKGVCTSPYRKPPSKARNFNLRYVTHIPLYAMIVQGGHLKFNLFNNVISCGHWLTTAVRVGQWEGHIVQYI